MTFKIQPKLLNKLRSKPDTRSIDTRMVHSLINRDPKLAAYEKELQDVAAKVRLRLLRQ